MKRSDDIKVLLGDLNSIKVRLQMAIERVVRENNSRGGVVFGGGGVVVVLSERVFNRLHSIVSAFVDGDSNLVVFSDGVGGCFDLSEFTFESLLGIVDAFVDMGYS